ncbi:hypothetical protein [Parasitella parasitica]|uniref:Homeobox domain-containing protein n=1 Tax=Parasitella parasitica TaxID=35722 RepID=A0A0B7NNZ2_9FUNG|nr:hypothetical protein [Parasitella parasitica]
MNTANATSLIDPVIYSKDIMVKGEASDDFGMSTVEHMTVPGDCSYCSTLPSGPASSISLAMASVNDTNTTAAFDTGTQASAAASAFDSIAFHDIANSQGSQDSLDIDFRIDLDQDDLQELETPSSTTILFYEMMQDFPDLSSFVCHPDFGAFACIWLDYRRRICMAQYPERRNDVQAWLKAAALQVHFCLVMLVRSSPERNKEATCMFSAFRRLKDRVEMMHSVINIVENGRKIGQTPLEAIGPLVDQAREIERNVEYFSQEQKVIPVVNCATNLVELRDPAQVSMSDLANELVSTYNMMPYDNTAVATPHTTTIDYTQDWDIQAQCSRNALNEPSVDLTSFQPADFSLFASGASTPAAFCAPAYNNISSSKSANRFGFETPLTQSSSTSTPVHQHALFSHIEPSWIHSPQVNWSSLPVTPATEHPSLKFLSYPCSPTCDYQGPRAAGEGQQHAQQESSATVTQASCPTCDQDLSALSPTCNTLTTISPSSTFSQQDDNDKGEEPEEDCQTPKSQDEDYSQLSDMEEEDDDMDDDDDGEWIESTRPAKKCQYTAASTPSASHCRRSRKTGPKIKELRKREAVASTPKTRRTATSYDAKTTHYLKSIFFDIYSTKDKLTKDQRRKVQQETGLKPRNITYWFSNHKRRFQHSLNVFKKTVQETQGKVKTYDDFLLYRRMHGLPEEVQEGELFDCSKSISF